MTSFMRKPPNGLSGAKTPGVVIKNDVAKLDSSSPRVSAAANANVTGHARGFASFPGEKVDELEAYLTAD
jgi:hypothetical protein